MPAVRRQAHPAHGAHSPSVEDPDVRTPCRRAAPHACAPASPSQPELLARGLRWIVPLLRTGSDTARRRRTLRLLTTAIREVNEYADVTVIPLELNVPCYLPGWLSHVPCQRRLPRSWAEARLTEPSRRARRLSVEHRNTVAPRVQDVLDTTSHVCSCRFAVDPRHEQDVVVGVDMADGGNDGEAYSVAVQGSPGGASSH